jgi:putative spermidine/putrescine transport system ATP-binding protein
MNQSHINIKGIHKTFQDGTTALHPVDLTTKEGEVLVLLGPSGCGKSTLLRLIAGLEKPTGGSISFYNDDITHIPPESRGIGFVFQQYALFPTMTVADNIAFGMKLQKRSKEDQSRKVNELLEMMNIRELKDRKPSQLSGGQQQRVAVARALAIEPKVLLLDEPLTALDAKLKDHLLIELAQLFRKLKITTVYVTHDQVEAMAIANRIVVMNKGTVEQIGTPNEIYLQPRSAFVAQFVGQVNQLRGTVISGENELVVDYGFHKTPYSGNKAISEEINVFVRPEDLQIVSSVEEGFEGTVVEVVFLGMRYRLVIEAGSQRLLVDVPNQVILQIGDLIHLKINENKIIYT